MTEPIVACVDGSRAALAAVEWAAEEAAVRRHLLRIVTVAEPLTSEVAAALPGEDWAELLLEQAARVAMARHSVVSTELLRGDVAEVLRGESRHADMMVLGSRGIGGFVGLLVGSVSRNLTASAACPVVVVRGSPATVHGEIVVGVDTAERSRAAIEFAFRQARLWKARVAAVHTWFVVPSRFGTGPMLAGGIIPEAERRALRENMASWREAYPDVPLTESVVFGHAAEILCQASAQADLVVVGSHSRSPVTAALLGSIAHGVLHHAHCPVAVVRGKDAGQ